MRWLDVDGLADPVMTDIPTEAKTGKPRRVFRKRLLPCAHYQWVASGSPIA
jgi:hypothetical protein